MGTRPRDIAQLKVLLGGSVDVCEWPSVGTKDLYRQIFNQNSKYKTYEDAQAKGDWYFQDTLAMLDNWVILKYNAEPVLEKVSSSSPSDFPDAKDNITISASETVIMKPSTNVYPILKNQPWSVDFNIGPMNGKFIKEIQNLSKNEEGEALTKEEIANAVVAKYGIGETVFTKILTDTDPTSPKIIFVVDSYYYVFDRNSRKIFFYKKITTKDGDEETTKFVLLKTITTTYSTVEGKKEQANEKTGTKNNKLFTLMFYPLGSKLYIGDGTIDPWKAGNDFVSFSSYVNMPASNIGVMVYGGTAAFTLNYLIHEDLGTFIRPDISVNNPNSTTLKAVMLGQKKLLLSELKNVSTTSVEIPYEKGDGIFYYEEGRDFTYLVDEVSYNFTVTSASGKKSKKKWHYGVSLMSSGYGYYSPAICRCEMYMEPYIRSVGQKLLDITSYVLSASVSLTVEQSTASITLTNRDMPTENFSTSVFENEYLIWGIRPISIYAGYDTQNLELIFKGYTNGEPKIEKTKDTATISLSCIDVSIRAKETFGINLPIYDGWCHLAAMRNLMMEAGYTTSDSQILPVEPYTDTCYEGHTDFLPNEKWHFLVPFHLFETPGYMFQMGTPLWDCMQTIRGISEWYLFGQYDGKLTYAPHYKLFKYRGNLFKETPTVVGDFDEIRRNLRLDVTFGTFRNAIYRSGIIVKDYEKDNVDTEPFVVILKQKGWPSSVIEGKTFVPWLRWDAAHDPSMNSADSVNRAAIIAAKRNSRERRNIGFSCWGKKVIPYEIIQVEENIKSETFINIDAKNSAEKYIVTAVNHSFSNGCVWDTSLECELYDPSAFLLSGDTVPDFVDV